MGAEFWAYYTRYRGDVSTTLEELRELEFEAGRYNRSDLQPATIQEAKRNAKFDGTRSILDMERISASPEAGAVSPVPRDSILAIFKTDRPTRQMVERAFRIRDEEALDDFIDAIDRGEGRYIVLYRGDEPVEIFFCGYSYD
jgi:hypothetical protein